MTAPRIAGESVVADATADALRKLAAGDELAVNDWATPLTVRDRAVQPTGVTYTVTGRGGRYTLRVRHDRPVVQLARRPSTRSPGIQYVAVDSVGEWSA